MTAIFEICNLMTLLICLKEKFQIRSSYVKCQVFIVIVGVCWMLALGTLAFDLVNVRFMKVFVFEWSDEERYVNEQKFILKGHIQNEIGRYFMNHLLIS